MRLCRSEFRFGCERLGERDARTRDRKLLAAVLLEDSLEQERPAATRTPSPARVRASPLAYR